MNDADLQRYREQLLELRGRLTDEINRMASRVLDDERPAGEHDHLTSEPVDKEVVLDNTEEAIRGQVMSALLRIDDGSYGQCQACGQMIAAARLDAVPYAAQCIDCERNRENEQPRSR